MIDLDTAGRRMRLAGGVLALGAVMMVAKGVLLMTTDNDRSLVPWFALFTSAGLAFWATTLAGMAKPVRRWAVVGAVGAVIGVVAAVVSVAYLVTGTIPESEDAPAAVGASYAISTLGIVVALLVLGVVIVRRRLLPGRWRWVPLGVVVAMFPIFMVAGAIGKAVESEQVTDGLGLALVGAVWMVLGYALARPASDRGLITAPLP